MLNSLVCIFCFITTSIVLKAQSSDILIPINYSTLLSKVPNTVCLVRPPKNELVFCGYTDILHASQYGYVLKKVDSIHWTDLQGSILTRLYKENIQPISYTSGVISFVDSNILFNRVSKVRTNLYFDSILFCEGNRIILKRDTNYALVDSNFQTICPYQSRELRVVFRDLIIFKEKEKFGFMSLNGQILVSAAYYSLNLIDSNYMIGYVLQPNSPVLKEFLLTSKGEKIAEYEQIDCIKNDLFDRYNHPKYVDINRNISQETNSKYYANDFFIVKKNGKFGLINKENKVILPLDYNEIELNLMNENLVFLLTKGNEKGYFIPSRNKLVEPKFRYIDNNDSDYFIANELRSKFVIFNSEIDIEIDNKELVGVSALYKDYIFIDNSKLDDYIFNIKTQQIIQLNYDRLSSSKYGFRTEKNNNKLKNISTLIERDHDKIKLNASQIEIMDDHFFIIHNNSFSILDLNLNNKFSLSHVTEYDNLDDNYLALKIDTTYQLFDKKNRKLISCFGTKFYANPYHIVRENGLFIEILDTNFQVIDSIEIQALENRLKSESIMVEPEFKPKWRNVQNEIISEYVTERYFFREIWQILKSNPR